MVRVKLFFRRTRQPLFFSRRAGIPEKQILI
jgi:hypothetical protein